MFDVRNMNSNLRDDYNMTEGSAASQPARALKHSLICFNPCRVEQTLTIGTLAQVQVQVIHYIIEPMKGRDFSEFSPD